MAREELKAQIKDGFSFSCYVDDNEIIGVKGIQDKTDVELIRHAYVKTKRRNRGIGTLLLRDLIRDSTKPILIGTWRLPAGQSVSTRSTVFVFVDEHEKNCRLKKYWAIPDRQVETSVVLADQKYKRLGMLHGWKDS